MGLEVLRDFWLCVYNCNRIKRDFLVRDSHLRGELLGKWALLLEMRIDFFERIDILL